MSSLALHGTGVAITGASRGIGRAVAEAFLREGAQVVAMARAASHLDGLVAVAEELPGTLRACIGVDLADPASVATACEMTCTALPSIDVLINNAGILGRRAPLVATSPQEMQDAFAIHVTGPLGLVSGCRAHMPPGAVVINVSSGAAGRASWGAYGVSKAAMNALTIMLSDELRADGVRCIAINPGAVRTEMRRAAYPLEDPATLPAADSVVPAFLAIARGAPTSGVVEARTWTN